MKIKDGTKMAEITIQRWNGTSYEPDWSEDYFGNDVKGYDDEDGAYIVDSVDDCIFMAESNGEEGARGRYDENGDVVMDENICIDWSYIN